MSKKPSGDANSKPIHADIRVTAPKEKTNRLVEMAAEQLATLLWKTWLHKKNSDYGEYKKRSCH